MSASTTRRAATETGALGSLSVLKAAIGGALLGLLVIAFIGPPGRGAFDPSTIVPSDRLGEMVREYTPVEFSTLSGFEYGGSGAGPMSRAGGSEPVPAHILALSGTKVAVSGFMLPLDVNEHGVSRFLLNASYDMCYFGAPTLPHQFIVVRMRGGRRTKVTHTPIAVFGTLAVREERRSGRIVSLYEMEADGVGM